MVRFVCYFFGLPPLGICSILIVYVKVLDLSSLVCSWCKQAPNQFFSTTDLTTNLALPQTIMEKKGQRFVFITLLCISLTLSPVNQACLRPQSILIKLGYWEDPSIERILCQSLPLPDQLVGRLVHASFVGSDRKEEAQPGEEER